MSEFISVQALAFNFTVTFMFSGLIPLRESRKCLHMKSSGPSFSTLGPACWALRFSIYSAVGGSTDLGAKGGGLGLRGLWRPAARKCIPFKMIE